MNKILKTSILGLILVALLSIPIFAFTYPLSSGDEQDLIGYGACVVDEALLLEELSEEEQASLNALTSILYKNELITIYLYEARETSLDELVTLFNSIENTATQANFVLTRSIVIQTAKYGLSYLDYLIENKAQDTTLEINEQYEIEQESTTFDEQDKNYYVTIQSEARRSYCSYGGEGLPAEKPYRITGWFPAYNIDGTGGYHDGIDLGLNIGTPLFATNKGTVVLTSSSCDNNGSMTNKCGDVGDGGLAGITGLGNFVIIKVEDQDIFIAYAHLTAPLVNIGDTVEANQQIGLSGHSGKSSGPHLHFVVCESTNMYDVTNSTKVINPCDYIQGLCEE